MPHDTLPSYDACTAPRRCQAAVVLAAGRGTRMQRSVPGLQVAPGQARQADEGLKALVPFHGWPFIAYTLSSLADAGIDEVCLVVRPGGDPVRHAIERLAPRRLHVRYAEQVVARGTADALAAASPLVRAVDFLVVNGDNYYQPATLARMAGEAPLAMAGFRPSAIASSRPDGDARLGQYALVRVDEGHHLVEFVEKPSREVRERLGARAYVSMQCWRLDQSVFDACRTLRPSARGELELPDAIVAAGSNTGRRLRVVPVDEDVLDLSTRSDIPVVDRALSGVGVVL